MFCCAYGDYYGGIIWSIVRTLNTSRKGITSLVGGLCASMLNVMFDGVERERDCVPV